MEKKKKHHQETKHIEEYEKNLKLSRRAKFIQNKLNFSPENINDHLPAIDWLIILMFTAEKSKLFFNDPKFTQISLWDNDSQEQAVSKIFAGQRQLRRSKIAFKVIDSSSKEESLNPFPMLDFLQSRINAFEHRLANNV